VLSPDLERVWQSLAAHPKSLDVLVSETGLTTTEVLVHLSRLELLGRVHQGPAADYRRRDGL
jgi:predicted Rossmann fold nucleotide-binding protein DprA/Smf involved in DNA uptake